MAEVVNERIEETLPELEQMQRIQIFTTDEIRQITSKRKNYEYKLQRAQKFKEDFLQYIQFETNLLASVKKRRERTGISSKKVEIDFAIAHRIHRLFRVALSRFPEDMKLWMTYIAFCKQRRDDDVVSTNYTKMLQVHNKKPELWISAAKWEFESKNNPETARSLIQRGIWFNDESRQLWLEIYRMELMYAEKMRMRSEMLGESFKDEMEASDNVLQGKVAMVVYVDAMQTIPDDVNFLLSFLPICQKFSFTKEHEEAICEELRKKFPDKPIAWDALARRCMGRDENTNDTEMQFHQVYEEAVNTVPSEEIWSLYIKACLELLEKKSKKSLKYERLQRALLVFEEAKDVGYLGSAEYQQWSDLLCDTGSPDKALEVTKAAVKAHPKVTDLWLKRLSMMITCGEALKEIKKELYEAKDLLPAQDMWPLLKLVLGHAGMLDDENTVVQILENAMIGRSEVSGPAKNFYLEHQYLHHGIDHVRKLYDRLQHNKPVSVEFYKLYINMELAQVKSKMKRIRAVYNQAVNEHGADNPDLWLDFIKMEETHPKGKPETIGTLYGRAIQTLPGSKNKEFIEKYTMLQTSAQRNN